ncbi:MAG: autotransporter outer membrane beta-barrel domain-containing protein, partial [Mailhella sp.]|nr:autotransporter outer membrane beta-barrel domain-containing protein [Mailhella sp.]
RFRGTGGGFRAGAGRSLDNGLTQGIHIAAAAGRTEIRGNGSRGTSRGAYLGAHLDYAPGYWDGFHLMGAARIGIEDSELDRRIAISGYDGEYRTASSSCWTGLAGGIMAGAGKDWAFAGDRGAIKAGPLFWSGYAFARNPNIRENGGAAALAVRSGLKDSLHLNFGAHINADVKLNSRVSFTGDLLAGWRHELLENGSRTKAAFLGYGDSFDYSGRPAGRDALLVQAALRLTRDNGDGTRFFTQLDAGAERFRKKGTDLNFGFNLGFTF